MTELPPSGSAARDAGPAGETGAPLRSDLHFARLLELPLSGWRRDLLAQAVALAAVDRTTRWDEHALARFARRLRDGEESDERRGVWRRITDGVTGRQSLAHEALTAELMTVRAMVLPSAGARAVAAYVPQLRAELRRLLDARSPDYAAYDAVFVAAERGELHPAGPERPAEPGHAAEPAGHPADPARAGGPPSVIDPTPSPER